MKEKQYNDAISKGDGFFNSKDYVSANASYTTALNLKPTSSYPKEQILKIKEIQNKLQSNELSAAEAEKKKKEEEAKASFKKLDEVDLTNETVKVQYLSELAKKYPEGITTENYDSPEKKIKRVIVKHDNVANEYREVIHSWGGVYYFKNGQSIAKSMFYSETK